MKYLAIVILLWAQVQAGTIECNEESFAKGEWEAQKIRALVDTTTLNVENQELETQLAFLTKNSSDLFKARLLNEENTRRWKSLEKICENESLLRAEKSREDAENRKILIQSRMTFVRELIESTKQKIQNRTK